MGCKIKLTEIIKFNKAKSAYLKSVKINFSLFLMLLFISSLFIFLSDTSIVSGYAGFVPNPPTGNNTTDINIENEYIIFSSDAGSFWKFDWGDGTSTDWIQVKEGQTRIMQSHSWGSYGTYELKVKHKSMHSVESSWSEPLHITVSPITDNPSDEQSQTDSDNDGLKDNIELSIGTNPNNPNDVLFVIIQSTTYCLIDTNNDGNFNYLYNPSNGVKTLVEKKEGYYLLDINNDKNWDYRYSNGFYEAYVAPFEVPWLYIAIGIIIGIIIILFILFKKGVLFFYQEEVIIEEK
jgi:hypothetical protein